MKKWFEWKSGRRILSLALSAVMVLSLLPMPSIAVEGDGLCEHHREHTADCGYKAAVEGHACGHVCGEECYTVTVECKHIHDASCYSDGVLPAETPKDADACTHACTEESGCVVKAHTCVHTDHEGCGYVEAVVGQPCGYACKECAGKEPEELLSAGDTVITDWEWVDDWEIIYPETGLAHLPFASAENVAYFDDIAQMLPAAIAADGEELTLGEWTCEAYPVETGAYEGEYVFETTLPEGYVLEDGTNVLRLTVVLGDPEGQDVSWYSDTPNTGTYTIDGTECTAYELCTADDLFWFATLVNDGSNDDNQRANAVLMNDITIGDGRAWTPIGGLGFKGKFDGQGHIIKNLHYSGNTTAGLFSSAEGAVIVNLGIEDSSFTVTGTASAGSICGSASEATIIKNCYSIASVTTTSDTSPDIGGLVGGAGSSVISNCFYIGTVTGNAIHGGTGACVGRAVNSEVMNCYYNENLCNLSGVGSPEGSTKAQAYGKTTEQFGNGTVAYGLSLSASGGVWGQRIREGSGAPSDEYPGFNDYVVYRAANYENYHNHKDHENVRTPYCLLCGNMYGSQLGGIYQITTKDQLYWFAAKVNGTSDIPQDSSIKGRLGRDITLVDGWKPIGNQEVFTGSFDGNGFTITCPSDTGTLFKTIGSGATIDHLRINKGSLSETNNGTITRCVVLDAGRKLCTTNGGTIINSYASGSGAMKLCDTNTGTIANCYAAGDSSTKLCGTDNGTIANCYTLAGDAAAAVGGTNPSTDSPFSSGEVAYRLNAGTDGYPGGIWGQAINTNLLPILYGKKIYFNDNVKYHNHNGSYCDTCNPESPDYDETKGGWQITNADDLNWFAAYVNGVYTGYSDRNQNAVLTADITVNTGVLNPDGSLSANSDAFEIWTPIGSLKNYTGTFDGQNHTISGLYCPSAEYAGLFGSVYSTRYISAVVQNVAVVDSYFIGTKDAGGVCGFNSAGTVQHCSSSATVGGGNNAGGVCGNNTSQGGSTVGGTIQSCCSTGMVSGNSYVGGVCGKNYNSTIQNCYFNSDVFTGASIGSGDGTNVAGKTTKEFASGEVAYLLNGSKDNGTWKQTIEGAAPDATPQLTGKAVYKTVEGSQCPGYTNNETGTRQHYHENHVCIYCGHQDTIPVTVSGIKAENKEYDGTKTATLDYSAVTLTDVSANDDVSVTAIGTFDTANVGSGKRVTITKLTLTGDDASKYRLADSGQQTTTTASITPKPLSDSDITVTVSELTYTGSQQSPTVTVKYGTITLVENTDYTLSGNTGTGAGDYTLTVTFKGNYSGSATKEWKINKAPAEITVEAEKNAYSKTYGDSAFQLEDITDNSNDADVQYSVSEGTDVVSVSDSGMVTILKAGEAYISLSLPESTNYLAAQIQTIHIKVAKKAGTVSITGDPGKTYDGQPATLTESMLSVTDGGGRTPSVEYKEKTAEDSAYTVTAPKAAGDYILRVTLAETDNYVKVMETKDFSIQRKPVTVSGISAENKTYDGTTTATLNYDGVNFVGKVEGDILTVSGTGTFADANAENDKIVAITGLTLDGASKDNYALAAEGQQNTATASIAKAASSVTAAPADARSLYTGGNVPLIQAGTAQGGTMQYRLGEDGQWSDAAPQAVEYGEYTVYYKVAGDSNHEDSAEQSLKARIRPFRIPFHPQSQGIKYGMDVTLSVGLETNVTVGISYQWCLVTEEEKGDVYTPLENETGSKLTLTKPNAGTYVYACIITCGDYSETSGKATVTVTPGTISVDTGEDADLSGFWLEGGEAPASAGQADIPERSPSSRLLTQYTEEKNNQGDAYPSGMKVYKLDENNKPVEIVDLGNLLRYSGCSIRITGKPGIRMITSLTQEAKNLLKQGQLADFTLEEYGTVVQWSDDLHGASLTLANGNHNYAYRKGVSDPVFANVGELTQYTNVLVWDELEDAKYAEDIVMRPYIILSKGGETVTLYGGTVSRSIGYVAQQNADTFPVGSAGYNYVHEIINKVNTQPS